MKRKKTTKQRMALIRGFIVLVIGIIIGIAYFFKYFPFNPINNLALLTAWSSTGWVFSAIAILYGLCEILIKGDL